MANWIATIRKLMPLGEIQKQTNDVLFFHHFF